MNRMNVLYVDDEVSNLTAFKATFRRDFNIFTALSAAEGLEALKKNAIEVILTDQRMPDMTGVEFLHSIIDDYPKLIRILVTGYSDIDAVIDAVNKGYIYKYVPKPWDRNLLKIMIEQAYELHILQNENAELIRDLIQANKQLELMARN